MVADEQQSVCQYGSEKARISPAGGQPEARNAAGAAIAFFGADMGMAGIRSAVRPDDVVEALADTQVRMPMELKFSHIGGLAKTASGKALFKQWKEKLNQMQE